MEAATPKQAARRRAGRGRRQRQQGARRPRVQPRAERRPAGDPRLGPRLRRAGRPPGRRGVGRARGDSLADHPGGREDRPLRLRGPRAVLGGPHRAARFRSPTRSSSGATPESACRSWARPWRWPGSTPPGRPSSWSSGCRSATGRPRTQGRRVLLLRARRRVRRLGDPYHGPVRRGQGRVGPERPEGLGDQRRDRQRPRRGRQGRPRAGLAWARGLRRPAGHGGARAGRQGEEARPARLAHRRRPPRRMPRPGLVPARRQGEARGAPRPGPRGQGLPARRR